MTDEPLSDLFEDIQARGELVLDEMCREGREETLYLEFKALPGSTEGKIVKEDARTLGRALSGLSNAEGGVLMLGIATRKEYDLDTADHLEPLASLSSLRNRLVAALPDLLSPQNEGIEVLAIPAKRGNDQGYLCMGLVPVVPRRYIPQPHHPAIPPNQMRSREYWQLSKSTSGQIEPLERLAFDLSYGAENSVANGASVAFDAEEVVARLGLTDAELNEIFNKGIPPELLRWREEPK